MLKEVGKTTERYPKQRKRRLQNNKTKNKLEDKHYHR